jgi:hypothetical protein
MYHKESKAQLIERARRYDAVERASDHYGPGHPGGPKGFMTRAAPATGNAARLRRLRKLDPELHAQCMAGELTVTKAMTMYNRPGPKPSKPTKPRAALGSWSAWGARGASARGTVARGILHARSRRVSPLTMARAECLPVERRISHIWFCTMCPHRFVNTGQHHQTRPDPPQLTSH